GDRRRGSHPLGGDPDPDRPARPARASPEPPAGLRWPALGARDPARLGPEGRAGDALGVRDGPGPRRRRRGVRGLHPGALDRATASKIPVILAVLDGNLVCSYNVYYWHIFNNHPNYGCKSLEYSQNF